MVGPAMEIDLKYFPESFLGGVGEKLPPESCGDTAGLSIGDYRP